MSFIDSGSHTKDAQTAHINFNVTFKRPPTVVVSPFWKDTNTEVGHAETIDTITTTGCTVNSGNAAANYKVNWIAIGEKA